jgi:hypothetical protein
MTEKFSSARNMYTVLNKNSLLGKSHFMGMFDSFDKAKAYAEIQAERSRQFASFEVWVGTPKNAIKPTKFEVQGTK